jgi:hypothetical protein
LIKKQRNPKYASLAAIEYHGIPGVTKECKNAVMRLIQFNDQITQAKILTWSNEHCLLLTVNGVDLVAIKSGFASGYIGEGSMGLAYVLRLLKAHGAEIVEYNVRKDMIHRVDSSCLTQNDLERLETARPVRVRWDEYLIDHRDWSKEGEGTIWREFPYIIPFAIINHRLVDLAMSFWQGPDEKLLAGWRRLEHIVRTRTGLSEDGAKLFSKAFLGDDAKLVWKGIHGSEQVGRGGMFTSAYQAFRNRRAHKETDDDPQEMLSEFLHLNHLFHFEEAAVESEIK